MIKNVYKNLLWALFILAWLVVFVQGVVFAQSDSRWKYGNNPTAILNEVNYKANANGSYAIQETALDGIDAWNSRDRIYQTLDDIRDKISPYLQWMVYIGLSAAVILLIYNWFLMVTGGLHDSWKFEKLKGNMINIGIWVLLLTWFYSVLKLIMALVNAVFGWSWWDWLFDW